MRAAWVISLIVSLVLAPLEVCAQHGRGGGGGGGGRGGNSRGGGPGGGGGGGSRGGDSRGGGGNGGWQGGGNQRPSNGGGGQQGGRGGYQGQNGGNQRPSNAGGNQRPGNGGGNQRQANGGGNQRSGGGGNSSGRGPSHTASRGHGSQHHSSHAHTSHNHAHASHHGGHASFSHRPSYHGHWHHGDWHGHWAHPWAYRPWGWYGGWGPAVGWGVGFGVGVAAVGVVSVGSPWGWGYYSYWNPYWVAPVNNVTYINYSQPVIAAPPLAAAPIAAEQPVAGGPTPAAPLSDQQEKALAAFDSARALFKRGDYQLALAQTNKAVALTPNDSLMHEFRALCLFATQDYQQSAAAVHAVLSAGPGWDWETVAGLYPSTNAYVAQLRALERKRDADPAAGSVRFLLAYHYMLGGHEQQAVTELEQVVRLEPKDQLSAQLLKGLTTPDEEPTPASGPALPSSGPVELADLVGDWKARRADGSNYELSLSDDHKFQWTHTQEDKNQQLSGTYTLADNHLILNASNQNALVGRVALVEDGGFEFRLAGGNPADPGLKFTR